MLLISFIASDNKYVVFSNFVIDYNRKLKWYDWHGDRPGHFLAPSADLRPYICLAVLQ
jgi:hypothetical protein